MVRSSGRVPGDFGFDVGVDAALDTFHGDTEGVLHGEGAAAAVGDDGDAVDAEERAAAVVLVIHFVGSGLEGGLEHAGEDLAPEVGGYGLLDESAEGFGGAFRAFEKDVADEAVADGDV